MIFFTSKQKISRTDFEHFLQPANVILFPKQIKKETLIFFKISKKIQTRQSMSYAKTHMMWQFFEASGSAGHKKFLRYVLVDCVCRISGLCCFSFVQGGDGETERQTNQLQKIFGNESSYPLFIQVYTGGVQSKPWQLSRLGR